MAAANSKSLLRVYEKAEGIFQRLAALVVSFGELRKMALEYFLQQNTPVSRCGMSYCCCSCCPHAKCLRKHGATQSAVTYSPLLRVQRLESSNSHIMLCTAKPVCDGAPRSAEPFATFRTKTPTPTYQLAISDQGRPVPNRREARTRAFARGSRLEKDVS